MNKTTISIFILPLLFLFSLPFSSIVFAREDVPQERGSISFKLGLFRPDGDSHFWKETEEIFTFNSQDLKDLNVGVDFTTSINRILEFSIGVDYFHSSATSEYRDYIGDDGFPIVHDTVLEIIPVQATFKVLPGGRYTEGRRRLFLNKIIPYIGGGLGLYLWEYRETGEFIDFGDETLPIYYDSFFSDGVAVGAHALAGLEIAFDSNWSILMEAKYNSVDDDLNNDFVDYGTIDLSGWNFTFGTSVRF
ncbi:MAG: hypothetical protein AB1756_00065 [Acidobacteriota bacterium]